MTIDLNRLKGERIAKGLTQQEMAERLKWTRSKYAKRESGLVPIGADELALIASVLSIDNKAMGIFFTRDVPKRKRLEGDLHESRI